MGFPKCLNHVKESFMVTTKGVFTFLDGILSIP